MSKLTRTFILGSLAYPALEMLYRGHTHWSMSLAGGTATTMIRTISRRCRKNLLHKCLYSTAALTALEYTIGNIVNKNHSVWDYSGMPLNVKGQICLPFSAVWFLLSVPAVILCTAAKKSGR